MPYIMSCIFSPLPVIHHTAIKIISFNHSSVKVTFLIKVICLKPQFSKISNRKIPIKTLHIK